MDRSEVVVVVVVVTDDRDGWQQEAASAYAARLLARVESYLVIVNHVVEGSSGRS